MYNDYKEIDFQLPLRLSQWRLRCNTIEFKGILNVDGIVLSVN